MQHPGTPSPTPPHNNSSGTPQLPTQQPPSPNAAQQPPHQSPAGTGKGSTPPPPITPDTVTVTPDSPTIATSPVGPRQLSGAPAWQPGEQPRGQSGTQNAFWQRLSGIPPIVKVLIAVGAVMTVMVCSCCGCVGVLGALGSGSPTAASTATTGSTTNAGAVTRNTVPAAASTSSSATPTQQPTATSVPTATVTPAPTATSRPQPTATPRPQPTATPRPAPTATATPTPCAVNCNPWGYNFTCCNYIYGPPSSFCTYFHCIPSFWTSTNGYVEECQDGMYSHSGGRSGSCSYHGGNWRPLLAP